MKQEKIDALLKGTRYEQAIEGDWQTNYDPDDDEQMEAIIGVQECGWCIYVPVCEIDCNTDNQERVESTVYVVRDAKLNAARVQILARALREIANYSNNLDMDSAACAFLSCRDTAIEALIEAGLEKEDI